MSTTNKAANTKGTSGKGQKNKVILIDEKTPINELPPFIKKLLTQTAQEAHQCGVNCGKNEQEADNQRANRDEHRKLISNPLYFTDYMMDCLNQMAPHQQNEVIGLVISKIRNQRLELARLKELEVEIATRGLEDAKMRLDDANNFGARS